MVSTGGAQEYQTAVRFYESQAVQEKLPTFPITSAAASVSLDDPAVDAQAAAANRQPAGRDDETQLQVRPSRWRT